MAIYYSVGDVLVGNDEFRAKSAHGIMQRFQVDVRKGKRDARMEFTHGIATAKGIQNSAATEKKTIGFESIGIGKPLTIQFRHVYTGNRAEGFWGNKDMLVGSAMKSIAMYDAAPRAVNFLVPKAKNNRNFRAVDATDKGTPVICYTPALALLY